MGPCLANHRGAAFADCGNLCGRSHGGQRRRQCHRCHCCEYFCHLADPGSDGRSWCRGIGTGGHENRREEAGAGPGHSHAVHPLHDSAWRCSDAHRGTDSGTQSAPVDGCGGSTAGTGRTVHAHCRSRISVSGAAGRGLCHHPRGGRYQNAHVL